MPDMVKTAMLADKAIIMAKESAKATKRRLSQLRLSREREDLLKARSKLTIPLVAKKVVNTKPKESKPLLLILMISSKVDSTTIKESLGMTKYNMSIIHS